MEPLRQPSKPATAITPVRGGLLQRACACGQHSSNGGECAECRQKREGTMQRAAVNPGLINAVPPIVHEVLRSPGQPLDAATCAFMEPRFGHDFTGVRVHTDARAAESARAIDALAYTVGRDVVFGAGQYAPGTVEGRRLLAHELTHVAQQRGAGHLSAASVDVGAPGDAFELEAETMAERVASGASLDAPRATMRWMESQATLRRQADETPLAPQQPTESPTCIPPSGIPNTACSAYLANSWWLPLAYVNNTTCACLETPNVPTANCVRKYLQDRLAATPAWIKAIATAQKTLEANPATYPEYQLFVQSFLTPRFYQDHVDAYANCCCPSGPAPYPAWIGVTTVPLPCSAVGEAIRQFGSCHGTPGAW